MYASSRPCYVRHELNGAASGGENMYSNLGALTRSQHPALAFFAAPAQDTSSAVAARSGWTAAPYVVRQSPTGQERLCRGRS